MHIKDITFQFEEIKGMIFSFIMSGTLICGYLVHSNYSESINRFKQQQVDKLNIVVKTVSQQLDMERLQRLLKNHKKMDAIKQNQSDENYFFLHLQLKNSLEINGLKGVLQVIIPHPEMDPVNPVDSFFVAVSSVDKPTYRHAITPEVEVLRNFIGGGVLTYLETDQQFRLVAFMPVFANETFVGVVQLVEKFSPNWQHLHQKEIWDGSVLLGLLALIISFGIWVDYYRRKWKHGTQAGLNRIIVEYQMLLDNIEEGYIVCGSDLKIREASGFISDILGPDPVGQDVLAYIWDDNNNRPVDIPKMRELLAKMFTPVNREPQTESGTGSGAEPQIKPQFEIQTEMAVMPDQLEVEQGDTSLVLTMKCKPLYDEQGDLCQLIFILWPASPMPVTTEVEPPATSKLVHSTSEKEMIKTVVTVDDSWKDQMAVYLSGMIGRLDLTANRSSWSKELIGDLEGIKMRVKESRPFLVANDVRLNHQIGIQEQFLDLQLICEWIRQRLQASVLIQCCNVTFGLKNDVLTPVIVKFDPFEFAAELESIMTRMSLGIKRGNLALPFSLEIASDSPQGLLKLNFEAKPDDLSWWQGFAEQVSLKNAKNNGFSMKLFKQDDHFFNPDLAAGLIWGIVTDQELQLKFKCSTMKRIDNNPMQILLLSAAENKFRALLDKKLKTFWADWPYAIFSSDDVPHFVAGASRAKMVIVEGDQWYQHQEALEKLGDTVCGLIVMKSDGENKDLRPLLNIDPTFYVGEKDFLWVADLIKYALLKRFWWNSESEEPLMAGKDQGVGNQSKAEANAGVDTKQKKLA